MKDLSQLTKEANRRALNNLKDNIAWHIVDLINANDTAEVKVMIDNSPIATLISEQAIKQTLTDRQLAKKIIEADKKIQEEKALLIEKIKGFDLTEVSAIQIKKIYAVLTQDSQA